MAIILPGFARWRRADSRIKRIRSIDDRLILTPSRRIARVAPTDKRIIAITFDDGPTKLPTSPDISGGAALTDYLLDELRAFGSRATFTVIGSTAKNYPDTSGPPGTQFAHGRRFDHFAGFGLDDMAGAEASPDLVRRIAREGHDLANHTYRHIIFGKSPTIYPTREALSGFDEAVEDLQRLHNLIYKLTRFDMRFMRPPHYIDTMADGKTSFDACEELGYHYLATTLDCGGGLPGDGVYVADVAALVRPVRRALERNPASLSGQIISLKDSFNFTRQSPVATALRQILELLDRHNYRVVPVSELVYESPFEDLRPTDDCFEPVRALDRAGFALGFRNNRFYAERQITKSELPTIFTLPSTVKDVAALTSRRPDTRLRSVRVDRRDTAPVRLISARAAEVFEKVSGQPKSNSRADVAAWICELAAENGII